ncbi:helix-turn-helix domain-containing protein [Spiractinospora alimapuensis]|uniref:helix-turn-helix domain-containing protein n=1 Tax=Spiractinospora alimapuensis TaxID=2820884 RepID=UPI001F346E7F|nr:helix-turn-helix transcriptional regulator [Spiractinospora alimapuensis]QVQ52003.1 helix-turn-helix domain-containing protein [Spiractinospora alimapuensis]
MAKRERRVTLRAQWLGQLLRKLREDNSITLKEAGEYLQKDFSSVSRFELGTFPVRRGDLTALMDLYGIDDRAQRDMLIQMCSEVWQTGWWESYSKDDVWGSTIDLVWLEGRAKKLQMFAALTLPGMLQTEDYARALITAVDDQATTQQINRWVELRMGRQQILGRDDGPAVSVVLDEAAIRRPVGGSQVMSQQLQSLLSQIRSGCIEVRVLPFAVGPHASPEGGFTLLTLNEPFDSVAHIESRGGGIYLERGDVDHLLRVYDRLKESALGPQDSAAFISGAEKDIR